MNEAERLVTAVIGRRGKELEEFAGLHGRFLDCTQRLAKQIAILRADREALLKLMVEFCDRVDRGETRSDGTYAKFKEAVDKIVRRQ